MEKNIFNPNFKLDVRDYVILLLLFLMLAMLLAHNYEIDRCAMLLNVCETSKTNITAIFKIP